MPNYWWIGCGHLHDVKNKKKIKNRTFNLNYKTINYNVFHNIYMLLNSISCTDNSWCFSLSSYSFQMQSSMNVNHPTSISVTRKRNVPKHMYHSSVFVGMVTFGTELTGKVKIDVLYQTRETDSVHHISRQRQESWSRVYLTKFRVLGTVFTLAEHSFFTLIEHFSLSRPADMQMSASKCLPWRHVNTL